MLITLINFKQVLLPKRSTAKEMAQKRIVFTNAFLAVLVNFVFKCQN